MYSFIILIYNLGLAKFNQLFNSSNLNRWRLLIFIIPVIILVIFLTKIYDLILIKSQLLEPLKLLTIIFLIVFILLFFISLFFKKINKNHFLEMLPIKKEILELIYYAKIYFFYLLIELLLVIPYLIIGYDIIGFSLKIWIGFILLLTFIPILAYSFLIMFGWLYKIIGGNLFRLLCIIVCAFVIFNFYIFTKWIFNYLFLVLTGNVLAMLLLVLLVIGSLKIVGNFKKFHFIDYDDIKRKKETVPLYYDKKNVIFSVNYNEKIKYKRNKSLLIDNYLFFILLIGIFLFLSFKKEAIFQFVVNYKDIFPYLAGFMIIFPYINYGSLLMESSYVPYYKTLPLSLNKLLVGKIINTFIFSSIFLVIFIVLMILIYDYRIVYLFLFLLISFLEIIVITLISMIYDLLLIKVNISQKNSININASKLLTILSLIVITVCKLFIFVMTNPNVFEYIILLFLVVSIYPLKVLIKRLLYSNN